MSLASSTQKLAMESVKAVIDALDLEYASGRVLPSSEIIIRTPPFDADHPPHKGITISPTQELETAEQREGQILYGGSVQRDDIGYPFLVTLAAGTGKGWDEEMDRVTLWRETIRREFNHQRLPSWNQTGVVDCGCTVQHSEVKVMENWSWPKNYHVSQLRVTCWFREPRTGVNF